jgi:hypothetical protein
MARLADFIATAFQYAAQHSADLLIIVNNQDAGHTHLLCRGSTGLWVKQVSCYKGRRLQNGVVEGATTGDSSMIQPVWPKMIDMALSF